MSQPPHVSLWMKQRRIATVLYTVAAMLVLGGIGLLSQGMSDGMLPLLASIWVFIMASSLSGAAKRARARSWNIGDLGGFARTTLQWLDQTSPPGEFEDFVHCQTRLARAIRAAGPEGLANLRHEDAALLYGFLHAPQEANSHLIGRQDLGTGDVELMRALLDTLAQGLDPRALDALRRCAQGTKAGSGWPEVHAAARALVERADQEAKRRRESESLLRPATGSPDAERTLLRPAHGVNAAEDTLARPASAPADAPAVPPPTHHEEGPA